MEKQLTDAKIVAKWIRREQHATDLGLKLVFSESIGRFNVYVGPLDTKKVSMGVPIFASKTLNEIGIFLHGYSRGIKKLEEPIVFNADDPIGIDEVRDINKRFIATRLDRMDGNSQKDLHGILGDAIDSEFVKPFKNIAREGSCIQVRDTDKKFPTISQETIDEAIDEAIDKPKPNNDDGLLNF